MTDKIKKPRIVQIYAFTAIALIIGSFFIHGCLDIAIEDTYYVIRSSHLVVLIAVLFMLFTLIIWGIEKIHRRLSSLLNWIHYGLTISSFLLIAITTGISVQQPSVHKDYSVLKEFEKTEPLMFMEDWFVVFILTFLSSQSIFFINVIRAFFIKKSNS